MEYLWDLYSVRITIKTVGGKLISARSTYLACQLSVRKLVPTLTSKSAEIGLSMAGASNTMTGGLFWFRSWAVCAAGVRLWRCIAWHRGARRGELQARQERRRGLQVPEG
jgi:hypothetical protein